MNSCMWLLHEFIACLEEGTGLNRRRRRGDFMEEGTGLNRRRRRGDFTEEGTGLNRRRRRGDYIVCIWI